MSILKTRWIWFSIFILLLVASITALATWKLKPGIDFAGGALIVYKYDAPVSSDTIQKAITDAKLPDATVQLTTDQKTANVRTTTLNQDQQKQLETILSQVGKGSEQQLQNVGPTIGKDLTNKAIIGVSLAILGILLYVAWAFRSVPKPLSPWQFGLAAVLTLAHDVLFVLGLFAVLGHFKGYTVDSYFITALLTVMGFSVHDTIVVFDRIRENMLRHREWPLQTIFDTSIAQTIARSINTSMTALIVLIALLVLGGDSIRPFLIALVAGIGVGTYSSIFVATPLLPVLATKRQNADERSK